MNKRARKKSNLLLILFTAIASVVVFYSCCIPTIATNSSAERYFQGCEAKESVIKQNNEILGNIRTHAPVFSVDYVSNSREYDVVVDTLDEVQQLSDSICDGLTNDFDKIRKIALYVANTISYDFDAAHNSVTPDIICLRNVLDRKRTTCAGFSNLFSALCQAQGIYTVNIVGCATGDDITMDNIDTVTHQNHEWTVAWYEEEERWVNVDCTWDSNNAYINGKFITRECDFIYFDIPMELISINHKGLYADERRIFSAVEAFDENGNLITKPIATQKPMETSFPTDTPQETMIETEVLSTEEIAETTTPTEEITEVTTESDTETVVDNVMETPIESKINATVGGFESDDAKISENELGKSSTNNSPALSITVIIACIMVVVTIAGVFALKRIKKK